MGELEEIGRSGCSERASSCRAGSVIGGFLWLVCFGLGLSGFGLEFGDGGVVFGFGVFF